MENSGGLGGLLIIGMVRNQRRGLPLGLETLRTGGGGMPVRRGEAARDSIFSTGESGEKFHGTALPRAKGWGRGA